MRRIRRVVVVGCLAGAVICVAAAAASLWRRVVVAGEAGTLSYSVALNDARLEVYLGRSRIWPAPDGEPADRPPGAGSVAARWSRRGGPRLFVQPGTDRLLVAGPFGLAAKETEDPRVSTGTFDHFDLPPGWRGRTLALQSHATHLYATLPLLAAVLAVVPLAAGLERIAWRPQPGFCDACGYDLRGSSGAPCPECGRSPSTTPAPRPRRIRPAAAVAATLAVTAVVLLGNSAWLWTAGRGGRGTVPLLDLDVLGRPVAVVQTPRLLAVGVAGPGWRDWLTASAAANLVDRRPTSLLLPQPPAVEAGWWIAGVPAWAVPGAALATAAMLVRRLGRPG